MIAIEEEEAEETTQLQRLTKRMEAFTEPTRLQIIRALLEHGAMNVKQLAEQMKEQGRPVAQSNISRNLKVLLDAEVVSYKRAGTSHFYSIQQAEIQQAFVHLQEYTGLSQ